jgi:hypothetical protein
VIVGSTLFVWAVAGATARQNPPSPPVVGIVSTNGLLLPLARWSGSSWTDLDWPRRDDTTGLDDTNLPPVPPTVAAIPSAWVRPLDSFPTSWRAQLVNVGSRPLHLLTPATWENAAVDSIAVRVDYKAAGVEGRMQFDAGIAVSGDVVTLPVRRLTRAAPEWHSIVDTHMAAFDRAQRMPWAPGRVRSRAAFRRWLLQSEVDLWLVTGPDGSFFYFEVSDAGLLKGPCPPIQALEGRISAPVKGPPHIISIQPVSVKCGDMNEGFEVLGALIHKGVWRLVVLSGGEGGTGYQIVDPNAPQTWRQF